MYWYTHPLNKSDDTLAMTEFLDEVHYTSSVPGTCTDSWTMFTLHGTVYHACGYIAAHNEFVSIYAGWLWKK
jgi:hypothetical protein